MLLMKMLPKKTADLQARPLDQSAVAEDSFPNTTIGQGGVAFTRSKNPNGIIKISDGL